MPVTSPAKRKVRVRYLVLIVAVVIAGCVGSAVGTFWWNYGVDHGRAASSCETCAVNDFLAAGSLGGLTRNDTRFADATCSDRRTALRAQLDGIAKDVAAATNGTPYSLVRAEAASATAAGAEVTAQVHLLFSRGGPDLLTTDVGTWTFHMSDGDGWRVCGLDAPQLCSSGLLNCSHTAPSALPSATPSDSGLLSNLDPMARCGPKDPFREWHDCPSGSPSSSSP